MMFLLYKSGAANLAGRFRFCNNQKLLFQPCKPPRLLQSFAIFPSIAEEPIAKFVECTCLRVLQAENGCTTASSLDWFLGLLCISMLPRLLYCYCCRCKLLCEYKKKKKIVFQTGTLCTKPPFFFQRAMLFCNLCGFFIFIFMH